MTSLDNRVLDFFVDHRVGWLTDTLRVVSEVLGLGGLGVLSVILMGVLVRRGESRDALFVGASMVSGWLLMSLLKLVFGRARPPMPERMTDETTFSFPSGHAMVSAVLATVVIVLALRHQFRGRALVVGAAACASSVDGISRLYLGAHWLTDVVAGWIIGAAWVLVWVWLLRQKA